MALPEDVLKELSSQIGSSQHDFPSASWSREANLHLTLAFIGAVPRSRVAMIAASLTASLKTVPAARSSFQRVTAFPDERRPRVIVASMAVGQRLSAISEATRSSLEETGTTFDRKPFRAHVTLARPRERWGVKDLDRMRESFLLPREEVTLRTVILFESRLSPRGATHTAVQTVELSLP